MAKPTTTYKPRLQTMFFEKLTAELQKELALSNVHEVPRIEKVVVNAGLGQAKDDKKVLEIASNTISKITGQKPVSTIAKKSIATFKLREGSKIGLKVTLRGARMYEFLDRVINIVLPRLRDFHGMSNKAFDAQGNYSFGFTDQSAFPELTFEETSPPHGLQVIMVIKSNSIEHSRILLAKLGVPFEKIHESKPHKEKNKMTQTLSKETNAEQTDVPAVDIPNPSTDKESKEMTEIDSTETKGEQPDEPALPVDGAMRGDEIPSHEPEQSGGDN